MKPILILLFCILIFVACNSSDLEKAQQLTVPTTIPYDFSQMPKDHDTLGKDFAKKQVRELLNGKGQPFTWDTLIRNSSTAIAIAEPILFDIFGKEQILTERPYEVYLIDGYWYLSGTIPKGWKGGGFEIVMRAKDGNIIRLTHYK